MKKYSYLSFIALFLAIITLLASCGTAANVPDVTEGKETEPSITAEPAKVTDPTTKAPENDTPKPFSLSDVPPYKDSPYCEINGGVPYFTESDYTLTAFESFSPLDSLGRCGVAYANVCRELMPTGDRGSIGSVKPSGWQMAKYDTVDGLYLYNRCHLLGWQLTGENANKQNLITGTRYMNTKGMLPFENMVADYVKEENAHVLYRVTPVFSGDELVARGVLVEAYSVEDKGDGISFCVFVYNVQPNIEIDYKTGDSKELKAPETEKPNEDITYILNTSSKKFHKPACGSAASMKESNKAFSSKTRDQLISEGYSPCGVCKP